MAKEIKRNFGEINQLIKDIRTSSRDAVAEGKLLDKALKVDPTNFDTASKKLENMSARIKQGEKDIKFMKTAQQEFAQSGGNLKSKEYQKLSQEILKAETNQKKLVKETQELNRQFAKGDFNKFNQNLDKASKGLDTFKQKVRGVSLAAKAAIVAIAGMATAFIKVGDELADSSKKLQTTVENLQIGRGLYENFAEGAEGYDQALKALGTTMTSIARGRGKAYLDALESIGLAQEDLLGKDTATQLDIVTRALSKIEDPILRAEKAMTLLNDAGRNVANMAGLSTTELDKYKSSLMDAGLITSEQAAAADAAANKLALMKQQLMVVTAQLIEQLMPIIMDIFEFVQQHIIPMLQNLFGWFGNLSEGGKKVVLIAITMVAILPTLISVIKGVVVVVKLVNLALLALSVNPVVATIIAIVVAIGLLITAFFALRKALGGGKNPFEAEISNITSMKKSASQVTEIKKSEELNINVGVEVKSDQPISETIARQISDDVVKYVNINLARKVQAR